MVVLLNLLRKAEEEKNLELARNLRNLVTMLSDLRARDLHSFLFLVRVVADHYNIPEILKIIPKPEEVEKFYR